MDMLKGGWTLVYMYNVPHPNIIEPHPAWTTERNVKVSKAAPQFVGDYGAIDYRLWKFIGTELLLKSVRDDWIHCVPKKTKQKIFPDIREIEIKYSVDIKCSFVQNITR